MAVVEFTPYTSDADCQRTNTYICDGHGLPPADRTNRYIGDGHGGSTACIGHRCPAEPHLASAYMAAKRRNYEQQHNISPNRKKKVVTHVQLYVSPSETDHVPAAERLEMTGELIQRTVLRDFPSIYNAHDNTGTGHCHISICPYSEDGSRKLCVNNRLMNDLRREMDRICVEHGYSIIENPALWVDKEYKQWFFRVKEEGKITIHPPKEQDRRLRQKHGKRARDFDHSKREQARRQSEREAYYKEVTAKYTPERDAYFYVSPYLYHPTKPQSPMAINRIRMDGSQRTELELNAAALSTWAHHCGMELEKRAIPGTETLCKRMHTVAKKHMMSRYFWRGWIFGPTRN